MKLNKAEIMRLREDAKRHIIEGGTVYVVTRKTAPSGLSMTVDVYAPRRGDKGPETDWIAYCTQYLAAAHGYANKGKPFRVLSATEVGNILQRFLGLKCVHCHLLGD